MSCKIDNYFEDDLYRLVDKLETENGFTGRIVLNPKHWIYSSHFPDNPITPGVCLLQISKELVVRYKNTPLTISNIKNIKFLSVLIPQEDKIIDFKFVLKDATKDSVSAVVTIEDDETCYTKISFVLSFS